MTFALGLLVAGLLVVIVAPALWRRAMRLARIRIEASVPLTRAEIDADKDQLRAGFAVSARRLEIETGRLRDRLSEETIAMSRHASEAAMLTAEKETLTATIAALETKAAALATSLQASEAALTAAATEIAERDTRIAEQAGALATTQAELAATQLMTEELRLEMVARQTEITNLNSAVAERVAAVHAAGLSHRQTADELAAERESAAEARRKIEGLEAGLAALQSERTGRLAELDRRSAELRLLEQELDNARQTRTSLAAAIETVTAERDQLLTELEEAARQIAAHAFDDTSAPEGDNLRKALAATEAEKAALAARLAGLEGQIGALIAENEELRRTTGPGSDADREENRRLRERLAEIAAGVARLGQSYEAAEAERTANAPVPLPQRQPPTGDADVTERAPQRASRH